MFTIHEVQEIDRNGTRYLRFKLTFSFENASITISGNLCLLKPDGEYAAHGPNDRFKTVQWNKELELKVLRSMEKQGFLKYLDGPKSIKLKDKKEKSLWD